MANIKISELPAASGFTADDLMPIVDDPGGTPVTQKLTKAQLMTSLGFTSIGGLLIDIGTESVGPGTALELKAVYDDGGAFTQDFYLQNLTIVFVIRHYNSNILLLFLVPLLLQVLYQLLPQ